MNTDMSNLHPMKISYVSKYRIWGGHTLEERYGKLPDGDNIGETWELTVRDDEMSRIISGEHEGKTLGELIAEDKSILGEKYVGGRFPLLIKFIDACDKLSVQVHPDDEYAEKHEKDPGKTEMWYILDAKPGARIVYGLADGVGRKEFAAAVESGSIGSVMGYKEVRAGETYFIPSGLLHAIGEGIVIAEIQQNSDLTYRVYDYDRRDANGALRELHVEKALDVVRPFSEDEINAVRFEARDERDDENTLAHCRYFKVDRYLVKGDKTLFVGGDSFMSILCLCGSAVILSDDGSSVDIKAGDSIFVPAGAGRLCLSGDCELITSAL